MVNCMQLERDALSRLFHTLRGWELPLLFENLRVSSATDTTGNNVNSGYLVMATLDVNISHTDIEMFNI